MVNKRLQRLIATLLMITLVFGNSSLTALASSGADADTRGDAIKSGTGTSNNITDLHRYGGGFKISILALELDTYAPKDRGDLPIYTNKKEAQQPDVGKTPISINGNKVLDNHKEGVYGLFPIYLVGGWNDKNEFAIDNSMNFGFREGAINNKEITKDNLKLAVAKDNIKGKSVADDIYNAFNQTNVFSDTEDINKWLKLTPVTDNNSTEEQRQRNSDVLNTILNLTMILYGENTEAGKYIKGLQEGNMKEHEVVLLIESLGHINVTGLGSGYLSPSNFIFGASKMSPKEYVNFANYADMRKAVSKQGGWNSDFNKKYGLYAGTGGYILGQAKYNNLGKLVYSTAIGKALGGNNIDISDPIKYKESLYGRVIYNGPLSWSQDGQLIRSNTGGRYGHGTLASSDFLEQVPDHSVKSASSSITILGQKSGLTPNISVSLVTEGETRDSNLDSKVSTAIQELDSFANNNTLTIENIEQHLNSSTCADILKILITEYNTSSLVATSMSNKQEDITGKITDILGSAGLEIDSLYIARYMNMLIKNGAINESGEFTFNTEVNKALIG